MAFALKARGGQSPEQRAKAGAGMLVAGRFLSRFASVAAMVVLARTLPPAVFGIAALADVILMFIQGLSNQGVAASLVQAKEEGPALDRRIATALGWQVTFTLPVALLIVLLSPHVAAFFKMPKVAAVLSALAFVYVVSSIKAVAEAVVKKRLRFEIMAARDVSLAVLGSVASVVLALRGFGVWSLVLPRMLLAPLETAALFAVAHISWRPAFAPREWRETRHFVASVSASYVLDFSNRSLDRLIVGKVLGNAALGLYSVAAQWSMWVVQNTVFAVGGVMFPLLSSLQSDLVRSRTILLKSIRRLYLISSPVLLGLFAVAPDFVSVLYGHRWDGAVIPFQILLLHALRKSVTSPINSVALAAGRPEMLMKIDLLFFPLYPMAFWFAAKSFGVVGVAAALFVTQYLMVSFKTHVSFRLLGLKAGALFAELKGLILASALMAAVVLALRQFLMGIPQAARLACSVLAGCAVYLSAVFFLARDDADWVLSHARALRLALLGGKKAPAAATVPEL